MAESLLREIVEQVVQITDSQSKEKVVPDNNQNLETEEISVNLVIASKSENIKVVRETIETINKVECIPVQTDKVTEIESESDTDDDILADENNNDILTTEDEAEDFLRHVLRESNSDLDNDDISGGFNVSVEGNNIGERITEKSYNIASALANIDDTQATISSESLLGETSTDKLGVYNKNLKLPLEQEANSLFSTTSAACVNSVDKSSAAKNTSNTESSLRLTISNIVQNKKVFADNNNNNICSSNTFDDTSLFKYDWPNCYNSCVADDREMCTPDAEVESISPELCCIMQLSPDAIYGKDHTIGCQRLYLRQVGQAVRPGSALNTPDPMCFGDTDSNESDMPLLRKYGEAGSENLLPTWSDTDINNNVGTGDVSKGTKRKLADVDNQKEVTPPLDILSNDVVTSLMHQGRPPDISTWKAVSPLSDSHSSCVSDDITSQWNKPTCTVPPFQNTRHFSNPSPDVLYGTARAFNPYELPTDSSIPQQAYNQYNMGDGMPRPSCQFTSNQTGNFSNYGCQLYNNGLQNSAAYRINFSSPVNMGAPGMLNFFSHPSYLGVDLTRPQAVYANNFMNMNFNTAYSSGPRYSSVPNRHCFNTGQFRNFHQPQSRPFQNPYMTHFNDTSGIPRNPPSATQTFAESQNDNSNETKFENALQNIETWKAKEKTDNIQMSKSSGSSLNREVLSSESVVIENDRTDDIVGCEECDLISNTGYTEKDEDIQDGITKDCTGDSFEAEETGFEKSDDAGSPTPAHAYPQVQNKYFTEIYMQKCRSISPITSFCTALDLSKKEEKKESKRVSRPTVPPKIRPYGEPNIPLSAVLNSANAPTLAYSGAMLVPYMNSIFAAMANLNKTQTAPLYSQVGTFASSYCNTNQARTTQSSPSVSPLTHTGSLTLNQQVLMYSNFLSVGGRSACSKNVTSTQNTNTVASGAAAGPTVNVNSIPLPLYATPLQYPIRPLVSVVNPVPNTQGLQSIVNPYLYRLNIGLPVQTAANVPVGARATIDKNSNTNTTTSSVSSSVSCSSSATASSKVTKTTAKAKKARSETIQRKRKSPLARRGIAKWKPSPIMPFNNTAPPPGGGSIAAVDRLNVSIQGGNLTATKPTQSKGLTTYQPIPDGRLYRMSSDRKTRAFKAKHFPFHYIQIGTFEYTCGVNCSDKVARVKFLFSKKVMVYEFQLENPDGSPGVCKDMVEIEVPFSSIISLWLYDKDLRVEVKEAPKSCLGKKGPEKNMKYKFCNAAVYDRKLRLDVTNGQLYSVPYHYVQFRNCCADRVKAELREFDNRFEMMLRLPLIEDPSKTLKQGTKQLSSQLLDPSICLPDDTDVNNNQGLVYQPELNSEVSVLTSCSCTSGCSAESCQCCVKGTTCSEGMCDCVNCRNPLNILHQLGLPADRARTDPCLMENIYQIKRLDCYVKTQLVLECCHLPVLLFSCIPGEVRCVSYNCTARYKYSWCTAQLLNEDYSPRNHCVKCGTCTDYRNVHCQRCKVCYFAGESHAAKCPICHNNGRGALGNNSSTDSDA